MARFFGNIGFVESEETEPGVFVPDEYERPYMGDVLQERRRFSPSSNTTLDSLVLTNYLSIVADDFLLSHYQYMRYVEWLDAKWKIESVEIEYPRIKITFGGVYNG